jgi:hypothetical protein
VAPSQVPTGSARLNSLVRQELGIPANRCESREVPEGTTCRPEDVISSFHRSLRFRRVVASSEDDPGYWVDSAFFRAARVASCFRASASASTHTFFSAVILL